jgi:hypothetical protein
MKRTLQLLVLSMAIGASVAPAALAASSPTVATGAVTKITDTTAVLNGHVNPNGSPTTYSFSYGPTAAYGAVTVAHSAGRGSKDVAVERTITGLTPGTVYHYKISATNGKGGGLGVDRMFTTTGHPPAAVVTGAPLNVGKTVATPTGSVNPEGAVTQWGVQYGLTASYGLQTSLATLSAVTAPLPVATELMGLAPDTLFHYRIVAFHGSVPSVGADATFFTEPSRRPGANLIAHTSPGLDKKAPYSFTTAGTIRGATSIPAAQRCVGNVGVRFFNGKRQLAFVVAPVGPDCTFSVGASFRNLHRKRGDTSQAALRVTVDYRGTGYVAPGARIDHVKAG